MNNRKRSSTRLVLVIAGVIVCVFGGLIVHHDTGKSGDSTDRISAQQNPQSNKMSHSNHRGLSAAGIPESGPWNEIKLIKSDSTEVVTTQDTSYGPAGAALNVLDALFDPDADDKAYLSRRSQVIHPDPTGQAHPAGDSPRWWMLQRRYTPQSMCTAHLQGSTTAAPSCDINNQWNSAPENAIVLSNGYQGATAFPIPSDIKIDSRVDPQDIARISYNTVYVPMDDGVWSVTTYCPASLFRVHLDKDGNEGPDDTDHPYTAAGAGLIAYGTRQHPCYAVEYTVSGQKPFWLGD